MSLSGRYYIISLVHFLLKLFQMDHLAAGIVENGPNFADQTEGAEDDAFSRNFENIKKELLVSKYYVPLTN